MPKSINLHVISSDSIMLSNFRSLYNCKMNILDYSTYALGHENEDEPVKK